MTCCGRVSTLAALPCPAQRPGNASITENDLLWASVCRGRPALPCLALALPCLSPQTDRQTPCLL